MSIESKLVNPFGLQSLIYGFLFFFLEILFNLLLFNYIEDVSLQIALVTTISSLLILVFIILIIVNRRKKIITIMYEEKKRIVKTERVVIYKIGRRYDLSKELLLNRTSINKEGNIVFLNLSSFDLNKIPRAVKKLKNLGKITKLMINLEEIQFIETKLTQLDNISVLKNLKKLVMIDCGVEEVAEIRNLEEIEELNLRNNRIVDINPLSNLKKLRILNLSENQIQNIEILKHLDEIRDISVSINPINDFTPIIKRNMDNVSFSVMYQAYPDKEISRTELTQIKDDWIKQFVDIRTPWGYNTIMQSGLQEYGYTVTLRGSTIED